MVATAGLLGAGVPAPLPANADRITKNTPVTYQDTDGNPVHCTLVQRIEHGDLFLATGETEISGPDVQCFGAEVCQSATWTDPFGHADSSAQACAGQELFLQYAPVDNAKPLKLTSTVHFTDCSSGCSQTFTFTK